MSEIEDIAISVLATVIGHQRDKGWILIDAGWMAMSQDRGTSKQAVNQGYGVVCDIAGNAYDDLIVADANQEHGIITVRPGSNGVLPNLAIGDRVPDPSEPCLFNGCSASELPRRPWSVGSG